MITHTHWDREWRYPICESRIYLAEMLDEVLVVLDEQEEYVSFLFDGQSVFLRTIWPCARKTVGGLKTYSGEAPADRSLVYTSGPVSRERGESGAQSP